MGQFFTKIPMCFFSALISLYNMGNSLEMFIICSMSSDKSVGASLRALVCVFQLHILTAEVRRITAVVRILTKAPVVSLFHAMVQFLSKCLLFCVCSKAQ